MADDAIALVIEAAEDGEARLLARPASAPCRIAHRRLKELLRTQAAVTIQAHRLEAGILRSLRTSTAIALAFGFGLALTGTAAAQQQELQDKPAVCDQDGNGFISTTEAADCDEQEASTLFGNDEGMSEEQFSEAYGDESDMFSEADADGDGEISQQEWMDWREQGFAGATEDTENQMPADDYEDWNPGFPEGGDQGIDEGSHNPATYGEEQQD